MLISRFSYFCNKTYLIALSLWLNMSVLFSTNNFHKNCSFNTMSTTCLPVAVQCQLNHLGIVDTAHKSNSNAQCCSSVSVDLKLECSQPEGGLCPGAQVPTSLKMSLFRVRRRWREMRINKKKKKELNIHFFARSFNPVIRLVTWSSLLLVTWHQVETPFTYRLRE